jgi:hypothetical protein
MTDGGYRLTFSEDEFAANKLQVGADIEVLTMVGSRNIDIPLC